MSRTAKFNIGDLVMHKRKGYRAVVIDVDPLFQASGRYNPQSLTRDFCKRNPWYRLLVDNSSQMTYVEECCLVFDCSRQGIENPNVTRYLEERPEGYHRLASGH